MSPGKWAFHRERSTSPRAACWRDSRTKSRCSGSRRRRDMTTPCPSPEELRQLLGDLPSDAQAERLAQHLDGCESCQARLEQLATAGTNLCQLVERVHESEPVAQSAYWP